MRIVFNLEYQTTFGEELVLNILKGEEAEKHVMGTLDGHHWTCELKKAEKFNDRINYYYSVVRGEQ
jgi:4-alpha-glucanotransferase